MTISYFAGRMHKMKSGDLKGMQYHNQRERESRTNATIDKSRSHLNYDLVNDEKIDYTEKIKGRIAEGVKSKRKIRSDAVLCNQWIITSDKGFFDRIGEAEEKRFFEESYRWFADRFGKENIAFATIHKDEHTPHMHIGVIPITKDGRLSSKELFNRQRLKEIQDKFPKFIQSRGFQLERGIPNKQEHVEPTKHKNRQLLEHSKQIERALAGRVEALKAIQEPDKWIDGIEVKEKGLFKKDRVEVQKTDWEYVKGKAKQAMVFKHELDETKKKGYWLEQRNELLEKDRVKARKYDKLGDLLGREKLENALEMQQQRTRTKERDMGLDLER